MRDTGKGQSANEVTKEEEEEDINKLFLGIMDGYNDTLIPSLSYFSPNNEMGSISRKRHRLTEVSWDENLCKDRKRREQMNHNLSVLRSMVPSLFNAFKPSKEKVIGETVDFIRYLQEETERLEGLLKFKQKEQNDEKPVLSECTNQNVTVSSGATFIAIQLPSRRGLVLDTMKVLVKHQAEVLEARFSVNDQRLLTLTATIRVGNDGGRTIDKIRQELSTL